MRGTSAWLAGLAGAAFTNALTLEKRESPAVLTVPLAPEYRNSPQLSKRSKTVDVEANIDPDLIDWRGNVTFGTPPQQFTVYYDSWGYGCWIPSITKPGSYCEDSMDKPWCEGLFYNQSASTTSKSLDETFWLNYTGLGTVVSGDLVSDVLKVGGVEVTDMNVTLVSGDIDSRFSLGYGRDNATSLTEALAGSGAINSPAYSLYNETLLFGGVNQARYQGDLYSFPIVNGSDGPPQIAISLDGISIGNNSNNSATAEGYPLNAILDNGLRMSFVPTSVAQALFAQLPNASVPDSWGQVNLSCGAVKETDTIEFKFGDLELELSLQAFLNRYSQGFDPVTPNGGDANETCYFEICDTTSFFNPIDGYASLGSNFFKQVYAVFDLDNDEVSLANLQSDTSKADDIVEITSGKGGVPGAKSAGVYVGSNLGMSALIAISVVLFMAL